MSSPTPAAQTVEARQQERADVYGTYVAVTPIDLEGARAFNVGDPVPTGHVDRGLVAPHQIAKRDTKAGRAALGLDDTSKG